MLSSFVRGFENALTDKECDDLIEWFERDDHIGMTKTANRITRKDKQMWMDEKDSFYPTIQKVKMDMGTFSKLKKGKLEPEASLDLHGMNLEQAYPALLNFIISAHNTQKRLVLVITGKGKNSDPGYAIPERSGVLRSQVPIWLKEAKLSNLILQVEQSHRRHGGLGALYVYLRRNR